MTSDTELRAYLLGTLPEADTERLENTLLVDDDLFVTARSVEDDLFDDFVRDRLTPGEREAFTRRYENGEARMAFARALVRRRPNVVPLRRNRWIGLAAAAVLLPAAALYFIRSQPDATQVARIPRPRPGVAATSVAVTLTLATSRSATQTPAVVIPKNAAALLLRIRLDPADRFDRYSAELRNPADRVVWQSDDLHAVSEGGDLVLPASVPSGSLDGAYELAVHGANANTPPEDIGFGTLEVHRAK